MRFTSRRRSSATDLEQHERELTVHNFLACDGHPPWEPRKIVFDAERPSALLTVPDGSWQPFAVSIDGQPSEFQRVKIGDSWLALGVVDDIDVTVEGHGFDANPLELRRLDRPSD